MKAAVHVFATCLLLSFGLLWQAGCNLDSGLQDPLRPRSDMQVLRFTPDLLSPTQVQTGGTQQIRSADGLTITTRPIIQLTFPRPSVSVRVNNGVSALITGYSVTYNFQRPGNPPTGLALYGGPLNIFVDAAPVNSNEGLGLGNGPSASSNNPLPGIPEVVAGFGTGLASFNIDVLSPEAEDLLLLTPNNIIANIVFFVQDINGNNFSIPAAVTLSPQVLSSSGGTVQGQ
ncbi:MAG: hypothetical protein HY816_04795 [Candidatus Wallbacteria bacterium]|nr:hypothetical protein [Candidatus Wallbacteria bacterium]